MNGSNKTNAGESQYVLLTGGAGYIGSHAAKCLAQTGRVPVVYDNLCRGHREAVQWGPFIRGSLSERDKLAKVLRMYRPAAVMHFAAFAYVGESVRDPGAYYANNVGGSLSLLEAMRDGGCNRLVFSSTCATYGVPAELPVREETPQVPVNPYGRSKLMVESLIDDFAHAHGLRAVCLRYFNAAGADPDGEIGESHQPETHLIPLCLEAAAGAREAVQILGTDYPTPDGTCIRDYVHVTDLAQAHVRALEYLMGGGAGIKLNLGNERGHSVREILRETEALTGRPVPWTRAPRRAGDPPVLVADATRARSLLGWKPQFPELKDILGTAWRWHQHRRF